MASDSANPDIFDSLLNLEDKYHAEGYTTGLEDGARAGRIEGRTFGLEKGFEKFIELGRLGGRADVWATRVDVPKSSSMSASVAPSPSAVTPSDVRGDDAKIEPLKPSDRLRRQVERLQELTDPESLSSVNDEESVNAFDERLREAKAKATLVGKMVGERALDENWEATVDTGIAKKGSGGAGGMGKGGGEMEDFAGLKVPVVVKKKGETESG